MPGRFTKLYTIAQNSRSNSTNMNAEIDNLYTSINTVDTDRSGLAGTGRTTETVKGNADALAAHKASSDHDTHNDTLYYRQSAVDSKVSDLAGVGRTTETIKGNSDALTTHKASSDHDTHTDAMYYRQATVDSKDTTTLTSAKSYSDGNLTTHKSSSDHDTHTDAMYYRQSAVDTKVSDLAGAGRTTETIKGNYDALTTHKNSSDHDAHTDAMYYRQATVDSKINNASKTVTFAAGTAFPSGPYTDGQAFWRSDLNQQFSYSGAVGAWLPSVPGNTTSHGASLNGVWHFDTDLYSTRGTAGTFTRASVANDPNTFASVASGLPRLTAGKYGKGVMIEEGTTNLVYNSDFETVTGTATVFSDPLTSGAAWTTQAGSATYAAGGATTSAGGTTLLAGNGAWKPLTGSGGQNLSLTTQTTYTMPATIPSGNSIVHRLYTDTNNQYFVVVNASGTGMVLTKKVAGTNTNLTSATLATALVASTAYTMTLALDTAGLLTAKLYSGTGTGGALLQTLTATDTSLTGGFLLGVGGDTGVVVSAASVTAPMADTFNVSSGAWALTTSAINGAYSMSGVGWTGVFATGYFVINVSPSTSYTLSAKMNGTNLGTTNGAFLGLNWYTSAVAYISQKTTVTLKGTVPTTPYAITDTSPSNAAKAYAILYLKDSGTVTIDSIQLEQKAYATSYLRNDSTSASATRNAETLTIPSSVLNASAGTISMWVYETGAIAQPGYYLFDTTNGSGRFWLYKSSNGKYNVFANGVSQLTSTNVASVGWHMFTVKWDGTNIYFYVDGALKQSTPLVISFTGNTNMYIGHKYSGDYQWNNVIDDFAVFNRALTDAEISALYQSPVMLNDLSETPNWPALTNKPTTVGGYGITDAVTTAQLGVANGVATLGADGKLTPSQAPATVNIITNPRLRLI